MSYIREKIQHLFFRKKAIEKGLGLKLIKNLKQGSLVLVHTSNDIDEKGFFMPITRVYKDRIEVMDPKIKIEDIPPVIKLPFELHTKSWYISMYKTISMKYPRWNK